MRSAPRHLALLALGLLVAARATAVPTTLTAVTDLPTCDVLAAPLSVHELGYGPSFPAGEQIFAPVGATTTTSGTCPLAVDNPLTPNLIVSIQNVNTVAFSAVYYVGNPGTTFANVDGVINGVLPAMRIDTAGTNVSLLTESLIADGIFAPLETWTFLVVDYNNALLPVGAFNDVGVPDTGLPPTSSGNIIAVPVPEPNAASLVALGLVALAARRRTQR